MSAVIAWSKRIAAGLTGLIAAVAVIAGVALLALDTAPGRDWVKDQIEATGFENGLTIGVGSIDGSLFSVMTLSDVTLSDPAGRFASAPKLRVDWNPFAFAYGHVDIDELSIPAATLSRMPVFNETALSDEPLLPDYTIDIDAFALDRLSIKADVTGRERTAQLSGQARIEDRRAEVSITASSTASSAASVAQADGGDMVRLEFVAVPQDNRLDLEMDLSVPEDGAIAAFLGLEGPLQAKLEGEGNWAAWNGQLSADWLAEPFLAIELSARDGVFSANGDAQLADLAPQSLRGMLGGPTKLDATAEMDGAQTRIDIGVSGALFSSRTKGSLALGASRFDELTTQLVIAEAARASLGLSASGVAVNAILDGPFTRPRVTYDLTARAVQYGEFGALGLSTSGKTRIDPAGMTVPLLVKARRVTGLDQAAGGALDDVQLTGDLLVEWPRLVSDNIRVRSSRLDAQLTLIADVDAGRYGGAIDGQIDDYRIESVGLFDVASGAKLDFDTRAGAALKGKVLARSTHVTNESVRSLLGGDMAASADVAYGRNGVVRLDNIRLSSPLLSVEEGQGTYDAEGVLDISASGFSLDYGPLGLQLAGTVASPVAIIDAPSPGLGIGLANVTAQVRGEQQTYRVEASGLTDFGPFNALVSAEISDGPMRLDIQHSELGGIGLTGRLIQSEAGPFLGTLSAKGSGLDGQIELSDNDGVQIAAARVRATNLALPGAAGVRVGRGMIDASVIFEDQPLINMDVQVSRARYFGTAIDTLRAQVELEGGAGSLQLLASGQNAFPFRVAVNADMQPDIWRAAVDGNVRGIAFKTETPARIVPPGGETPDRDFYELLPTSLAFDRGEMRISGRFGDALQLKTRLDAIDLAILNRLSPGLGINGNATGSFDFTQANAGAMPIADAKVQISGFSRSTALTISDPVDVSLAGQIRDRSAVARAVVRQGSEVIGRIHTNLASIPSDGGSWIERLFDAQLGGGLRYNGSAATVFSLAGLADQQLNGALGIAADFSGSLFQPSLEGIVRASDLTYENQTYGTRLSGMDARARFTGDTLVIEQLEASAGKGRVKASGRINIAADQGFPMDIAISLDKAQLARSRDLGASATGDLSITKRAGERALLAGTLFLPETRYILTYAEASEIPELAGVRFDTDNRVVRDQIADGAGAAEPGLRDLRLDLTIKADDQLFVTGMGLQSEWSADLRVTGTSADPRLTGDIELVRGTLDFASREFDIQRGRIRFTGGAAFDPTIAISATETIKDVAVTVDVEGRAFSPEFEFTSAPGLPQDEILARILFGSSLANLSALEAVQLAQSLNALSGSGGGLNPIGALQSATGLDRLKILASDDTTGRNTAVAAGQYISDDIYVEVITDARGFTATQLEISLSQTLSVLSQASGNGGTNVNLRYRKDY